ncbi:hypothetical protein GCM10027043_40220 [Ferruginibacter profundus]
MPVANIVPLGGGNECEARRLRCIASVSAQSILMHAGCATADLTIILGIICHSAALVYQAAESGRCNDAAQDCSASQQ